MEPLSNDSFMNITATADGTGQEGVNCESDNCINVAMPYCDVANYCNVLDDNQFERKVPQYQVAKSP